MNWSICKKKLSQQRRCEGHHGYSLNPSLPRSNVSSKHSLPQVQRSSTCESDSYELSGPDWAAEEEACDEEVRLITGDSTDHDDIDELECEDEVTESCPLVTERCTDPHLDRSYDASCCIVVSCWVERLNFKKLRSYNTQVSKPSTWNSWPTSASSISFVVLDFVQLF